MKFYALIAIISVIGLYSVTNRNLELEETGKKDYSKIVYCAPDFDPDKIDGDAPLLKGLGNIKFDVTTQSKKARQYFNQGLALTYGFNHSEAARSFKTAIRIDSSFAMAYWGLAMVLGPNYNSPLNPTSLETINDAVSKAVIHSWNAKPHEKVLIDAIAKRFPAKEVTDITSYYESYAEAMKQAHRKFPSDIDIATLYADALMNLHPWNLWLKDGTPQPWTPEIIDLLEGILKQSPEHPGAIHYYIHAIEQSKQAYKAIPYADHLRDAMPSAGHLVHMPSHIYIRTGDYHKGVIANEKASAGDSVYIAQCKAQGFYPMLLYPHNIHFLAACAFLEGNSEKALNAAWMVSRKADRKYLSTNITVQHFYIIPYYVMVNLGKWNEILELRHPGEELKYPAAIWHYARGMAYAAKGEIAKANIERDLIKEILKDESLKSIMIWDMNSAFDLISIALYTLEGEILGHTKNYDEAISKFRKAIAIEDKLNYNEPPDWFFSIRLTLGHWQNIAGYYKEAEKTYTEDLDLFKENGWALKGLQNSLIAQGKSEQAIVVEKRFNKAWKHADIIIQSSRVY